jgi:uncharacterized membrane protein YkvA (DUF1232 family)
LGASADINAKKIIIFTRNTLVKPADYIFNCKEWLKKQLKNWQLKAKVLKRQAYTIFLAYRDPRVPWYAKLLAVLVIGYAFSPIDLIPDFIPILGYIDDLILIPLGIKLLIYLIPPEVIAEYQEKAETAFKIKPKSRFSAVVIILIWIMALLWFVMTVYRFIAN